MQGRALVKEPDRISDVQTPWLDEEEAEKIIGHFRTKKDVGSSYTPARPTEEETMFGELIL